MKEVLNLRIKDIDFGFQKIYIYDSKSLKDRTVPLPKKLEQALKIQVVHVEELHREDKRYTPNTTPQRQYIHLFSLQKSDETPL